ncbi:MAG TPA: ferritin-like domain-containing protein [Syntrophales bacterium]|nr:ferritin-like domain-containing protein [Syntrophales bacterium]
MASKKLLEMLNESIARELQVSIQYMWHYVMWRGVKGFSVKDELKKIAIAEMKHAEEIAERLFFLGGVPTTQHYPIDIPQDLKSMIEKDKQAEEGGIALYKEVIKTAEQEGDIATAQIFKGILVAEEEHLDTFTSLLEEI